MTRRELLASALISLGLSALSMVDDAPDLQRRIDRDDPIHGGEYWILTPIDIKGRTLDIERAILRFVGDGVMNGDDTTRGVVQFCLLDCTRMRLMRTKP